jgi:hypothetical protein
MEYTLKIMETVPLLKKRLISTSTLLTNIVSHQTGAMMTSRCYNRITLKLIVTCPLHQLGTENTPLEALRKWAQHRRVEKKNGSLISRLKKELKVVSAKTLISIPKVT